MPHSLEIVCPQNCWVRYQVMKSNCSRRFLLSYVPVCKNRDYKSMEWRVIIDYLKLWNDLPSLFSLGETDIRGIILTLFRGNLLTSEWLKTKCLSKIESQSLPGNCHLSKSWNLNACEVGQQNILNQSLCYIARVLISWKLCWYVAIDFKSWNLFMFYVAIVFTSWNLFYVASVLNIEMCSI